MFKNFQIFRPPEEPKVWWSKPQPGRIAIGLASHCYGVLMLVFSANAFLTGQMVIGCLFGLLAVCVFALCYVALK